MRVIIANEYEKFPFNSFFVESIGLLLVFVFGTADGWWRERIEDPLALEVGLPSIFDFFLAWSTHSSFPLRSGKPCTTSVDLPASNRQRKIAVVVGTVSVAIASSLHSFCEGAFAV